MKTETTPEAPREQGDPSDEEVDALWPWRLFPEEHEPDGPDADAVTVGNPHIAREVIQGAIAWERSRAEAREAVVAERADVWSRWAMEHVDAADDDESRRTIDSLLRSDGRYITDLRKRLSASEAREAALRDDVERLRARVHEVARAKDAEHAERHRELAKMQAERERAREYSKQLIADWSPDKEANWWGYTCEMNRLALMGLLNRIDELESIYDDMDNDRAAAEESSALDHEMTCDLRERLAASEAREAELQARLERESQALSDALAGKRIAKQGVLDATGHAAELEAKLRTVDALLQRAQADREELRGEVERLEKRIAAWRAWVENHVTACVDDIRAREAIDRLIRHINTAANDRIARSEAAREKLEADLEESRRIYREADARWSELLSNERAAHEGTRRERDVARREAANERDAAERINAAAGEAVRKHNEKALALADSESTVGRLTEALEREVVEVIVGHGRKCILCDGEWDRASHPSHASGCALAPTDTKGGVAAAPEPQPDPRPWMRNASAEMEKLADYLNDTGLVDGAEPGETPVEQAIRFIEEQRIAWADEREREAARAAGEPPAAEPDKDDIHIERVPLSEEDLRSFAEVDGNGGAFDDGAPAAEPPDEPRLVPDREGWWWVEGRQGPGRPTPVYVEDWEEDGLRVQGSGEPVGHSFFAWLGPVMPTVRAQPAQPCPECPKLRAQVKAMREDPMWARLNDIARQVEAAVACPECAAWEKRFAVERSAADQLGTDLLDAQDALAAAREAQRVAEERANGFHFQRRCLEKRLATERAAREEAERRADEYASALVVEQAAREEAEHRAGRFRKALEDAADMNDWGASHVARRALADTTEPPKPGRALLDAARKDAEEHPERWKREDFDRMVPDLSEPPKADGWSIGDVIDTPAGRGTVYKVETQTVLYHEDADGDCFTSRAENCTRVEPPGATEETER